MCGATLFFYLNVISAHLSRNSDYVVFFFIFYVLWWLCFLTRTFCNGFRFVTFTLWKKYMFCDVYVMCSLRFDTFTFCFLTLCAVTLCIVTFTYCDVYIVCSYVMRQHLTVLLCTPKKKFVCLTWASCSVSSVVEL